MYFWSFVVYIFALCARTKITVTKLTRPNQIFNSHSQSCGNRIESELNRISIHFIRRNVNDWFSIRKQNGNVHSNRVWCNSIRLGQLTFLYRLLRSVCVCVCLMCFSSIMKNARAGWTRILDVDVYYVDGLWLLCTRIYRRAYIDCIWAHVLRWFFFMLSDQTGREFHVPYIAMHLEGWRERESDNDRHTEYWKFWKCVLY